MHISKNGILGHIAGVAAVLVLGAAPLFAYADGGLVTLATAGRNVTRGQSGEYASLYARGGDTLDLILRVRSQSGAYLTNVFVTDYLPIGVMYIPNSTALNGIVVADGVTSTGLNIGTLVPWQTATVKFSVRVDGATVPTTGQVKVFTTAQSRADGTGTVGARMAVTLGQSLVVSASGVQTGPADAALLALAASLLTTGVYATYTRTGAFSRRMALAEICRLARSDLNFSR